MCAMERHCLPVRRCFEAAAKKLLAALCYCNAAIFVNRLDTFFGRALTYAPPPDEEQRLKWPAMAGQVWVPAMVQLHTGHWSICSAFKC